MKRAHSLLKAAEGWRDADIAAALDTEHSTVERIRQRFVERGLTHALNEDARPGQKRRLDGRRKRISWRWCIMNAATQKPVGVCACWPINWSNWREWIAALMKRCAKTSKKRAETPAKYR